MDTLSLMQQRYWALWGREQIKRVIHKCITCKKLEGIPSTTTCSPNLPQFCVDEGPPFNHVGIDFAGSFYAKSDKVDDENSKAYVCLFMWALC